MKRIAILIIVTLMPIMALAQAQIDTKKMKIADFPEKVTKVVLTGNDFFDQALQEDVAATWRESPYEFCTMEEFESLKTDDNFYFLITTKDQFRRESAPGIQFMSLLKGGPKAANGIGEMLEVAAMPIASAEEVAEELMFQSATPEFISSSEINLNLVFYLIVIPCSSELMTGTSNRTFD